MYSISKNSDHLLVTFIEDFDYAVIETVIRDVMMLREYSDTNDIWHIGEFQADVHLGEIDLMVNTFHGCCPPDATRTKTAIVVSEGTTGSIMELWVSGLKSRVEFDINIFRTLEDARDWLGGEMTRIA